MNGLSAIQKLLLIRRLAEHLLGFILKSACRRGNRIRQQCPIRNQSPAHLSKSAFRLSLVLANGRDLLRGCDVPPGGPLHILRTNVKMSAQPAFFGRQSVSSAHVATFIMPNKANPYSKEG